MEKEEEDEALWWHTVLSLLREGHRADEACDGANILVNARKARREADASEAKVEKDPLAGAA